VINLLSKNQKKDDSQGYLIELLADHETIIVSERKYLFCIDYNDLGTNDFIQSL
jgi:starvation-inducible DNA-binding protein